MQAEMAPESLSRDLELALETTLMLAAPGDSLRNLAERIYDSERTLMEHMQKDWTLDRLVWLLKRKRRNVVPFDQYLLPGFEKLPRRLTLKGNRRVQLLDATLEQLKEFRRVLWKRRDPRLPQVDAAIALVKRHSQGANG